MRRLFSTCVIVAVFVRVVMWTAAQEPKSPPPDAAPIALDVWFAPIPVLAEGKSRLVYELQLLNSGSDPLQLTRLEVLAGEDEKPVATYERSELAGLLARKGAPAEELEKRLLAPQSRVTVFLDIKLEPTAVPEILRHRVFFRTSVDETEKAEESHIEARTKVDRAAPLVIGAPLRGDGWLAANGLSNTSEHRRALVTVDGKARIAQRFATDWGKLGSDGLVVHDDTTKNANWYGYGAEVLAVADGVVTQMKDGIPENVPLTDKYAVPITLETVAGNHVILDLGNDRFALYAHLQPGSLRVQIGTKVSRGQVLGLLGNSGNSDAPHLHFHIGDANSPLGAEGVPYVLDSLDIQGVVPSLDALIAGEPWRPKSTGSIDRRHREIPLENAVVNFP